MNVTLKSYLVLFVTKHWHVFHILSQYTRAMGCSPHVVRYDLIIAGRMGSLHSYLYCYSSLCYLKVSLLVALALGIFLTLCLRPLPLPPRNLPYPSLQRANIARNVFPSIYD